MFCTIIINIFNYFNIVYFNCITAYMIQLAINPLALELDI